VYRAFETDCDATVAQRAGVKVPAAKVVQNILDDVGKDVAKTGAAGTATEEGAAQQHAAARSLIRKRRCCGTLGRLRYAPSAILGALVQKKSTNIGLRCQIARFVASSRKNCEVL